MINLSNSNPKKGKTNQYVSLKWAEDGSRSTILQKDVTAGDITKYGDCMAKYKGEEYSATVLEVGTKEVSDLVTKDGAELKLINALRRTQVVLKSCEEDKVTTKKQLEKQNSKLHKVIAQLKRDKQIKIEVLKLVNQSKRVEELLQVSNGSIDETEAGYYAYDMDFPDIQFTEKQLLRNKSFYAKNK